MSDDTPTNEDEVEKSPNETERYYQERDGEKDKEHENTAAPGELPEDETEEGDQSEEPSASREEERKPSFAEFVRGLLRS